MLALRPHQTAALRAASPLILAGRRVVVVMPTGGGKTHTAAYAVGRHLAGCSDSQRRVVWLAHRAELVSQAVASLKMQGIDAAPLYVDGSAPCVVSTVQAIVARGAAPRATLVVADEAHHYVSDEWQKVLSAYAGVPLLGLTATPERADGRPLGGAFDDMIVAASVRELVDAGYLVDCNIKRPDRMLDRGEIVQHPVEAYLAHARGRRAVVFARGVEVGEGYAQAFREAGVRATFVDGKTPALERAKRLEAFADGSVSVLVNCMVLTEGWDCPACDVCILARRCGSQGMYIQIVGRVLRAHPGKGRALLIDLAGVSYEMGHPLADREFSLDGEAIRLTEKLATVCRTCSRVPCECPEGLGGIEAPRVVGGEMVDWRDTVAALPDSKLAQMLAKFMRDASQKGHKTSAAYHKFKACARRFPDGALIQQAHDINRRRGS